MSENNLRPLVRGMYDIQKVRIQLGNRIVGNFKAKMGQEAGKPEEELSAEAKLILNNLRASYKKLTDGVTTFPRRASFVGDGVIDTYTELCLIDRYLALEDDEVKHQNLLKRCLGDYPVFESFLDGVTGCGPSMSGVIISEIDIAKCKYASSLWAYAGLDVAQDGAGRSRRQDHLVDRVYLDRDGKEQTRKGVTFNPFLKTKLYVLGTCFMKQNKGYKAVYDNYKHRLECHEKHKDKTKGHRHAMAMRYMIKRFLVDLYVAWRTIEGLEVHAEYHEAKLGHVHAA